MKYRIRRRNAKRRAARGGGGKGRGSQRQLKSYLSLKPQQHFLMKYATKASRTSPPTIGMTMIAQSGKRRVVVVGAGELVTSGTAALTDWTCKDDTSSPAD